MVVKGRVIGVGYRELVDERAFSTELSGFVRELGDGAVEVVCEGDSEAVQSFIKRISVVKFPIRVSGVEVRYSDATGEYPDFRILREGGPLSELCERLESALRCVREMRQEMAQMLQKELRDDDEQAAAQQAQRQYQSRMLVVQHRSLERQDRTLRVLEDMLRKQERFLRKQDAAAGAIRSLDRHAAERSARLGRRLDRLAASVSAASRDVCAIRKNGTKRKLRRKKPAILGMMAEPAPAPEKGVNAQTPVEPASGIAG